MYCTVMNDPAAAEQPSIGVEDAVRPFRIDEPAQRGDVVYERILRLDEDHVGYVVKRFGGGCASVTAADDYHCCHSITAP
jgi:hypothetical protein